MYMGVLRKWNCADVYIRGKVLLSLSYIIHSILFRWPIYCWRVQLVNIFELYISVYLCSVCLWICIFVCMYLVIVVRLLIIVSLSNMLNILRLLIPEPVYAVLLCDRTTGCEAYSFTTDGYGIFNVRTPFGCVSYVYTRRRIRHTQVCTRVDSERQTNCSSPCPAEPMVFGVCVPLRYIAHDGGTPPTGPPRWPCG